jgi:hypothetical protein
MDNPLDLASVWGWSISGLWIIGAVHLNDVTGSLILKHAHTFYDIGISQAYLTSGTETVIFFRRIFMKVLLFDI